MDLTKTANRLDEYYSCELRPAEESKELSNLNEEDVVCIYFIDSDEYLELYAKEITAYLDNCDSGKLLDNLEYFSVDKYLLRIEPANEAAFQYFRGDHYDLSTTDNVIKYDRLMSLEQQAEQQTQNINEKLLSDSPQKEDIKKYYDRKIELDEEIAKIKSAIILPTNRHFEIQLLHKDCEIVLSIIQGASEFGLWIAKMGYYEKWFPPVVDEDLFIEIKYNNKLEIDECRLLAEKYIYELSTQIGTEVCKARRGTIDEGDYSESSRIGDIRKRSLLGFSIHRLSKELYSLYHKAISTDDNDFTILNYIKIIEFVSQTVSRIQMYNIIRAKLAQRDSISPPVHFIEELRKIYDKLKLQTQDRELLKMTINTCCDINSIEIPDCATLQFLTEAKSTGEKQAIKTALRSLAGILYATRNQIAHAKMNYQETGDECPSEDQPALIECLKSISEQCIRWFESQAEGMKYSD